MASIGKRKKALSVRPLKISQPLGASLAFLGLERAIPMLHGAQGCTAFAKVMMVRHFREPIPLQTTAMEQISAVMGADGNIVEGLRAICEKNSPAVIGLLTTGLSETQGTDVHRAVKEFRAAYPDFTQTAVIAVNTPDYSGSLETGFALAVRAIVETAVPPARDAGTRPGRRPRQVNVLASASLTPGDLEAIKELCEQFELRPIVLPDISDALDGHLTPSDFNPLTAGGASLAEIALMGDSIATLVIGASLNKAADSLRERTGVPDYRFDHLLGLDATDRFVHVLSQVGERPVPARIERHRAQLQDAMVDCHFMIGQARIGIAAESEQLLAITEFMQGMGAEVTAAVAPTNTEILKRLPLPEVKVGDIEDLEAMLREAGADLLIGNSHLSTTAQDLGIALLRMGIPQYDHMGGYQKQWVGYRGARQLLFELANSLMAPEHHEIKPYRSVYTQKNASVRESEADGHAAPIAGS